MYDHIKVLNKQRRDVCITHMTTLISQVRKLQGLAELFQLVAFRALPPKTVMSVLSVLLYIVHGKVWSSSLCTMLTHAPGTAIRRRYIRRSPSDVVHLESFSRILVGQEKWPSMSHKWRRC